MNKQKNKTSKPVKVYPVKFFMRSLKWLNMITNCSQAKFSSAEKVLFSISNVYNNRGVIQCIKYVKDLRHRYLTYLFNVSGPTRGDQPRLPRILRPFYLSGKEEIDYPISRLVLSTLYLNRFIRLKPNPSWTSITKSPGYVNSQDFDDLRPDVIQFLKFVGVNRSQLGKPVKSLNFTSFHMTSKSGPNGHALWTSYRDLMGIGLSLFQSIKIVGGDKLYDLCFRFLNLYKKIPKFFDALNPRKRSADIRRLAVISDKEGKTREVAILDYWSQAALRPLHDKIYRLLHSIDQDCTHDQTKHLKKLVPDPGSSFHSIDLTTATDRFPIAIERLILDVWFGKEYADAWKHIMVGFPFEYQDLSFRYGTGNPMGAYSSWATFALAHHFMVYLSCKRAGRSWKRCPYMLLGDDIVIANDDVAKAYKDILIEWDIPYSHEKTHVSKLGYEFAKQIILKDQNISPFPLAALYERRNSPIESVGIIFRELTIKDWTSNVFPCLKEYFRFILGWNYPKIRVFFPKVKLVLALLSYLQSNSDLGTPIKEYVADITKQEVKWPKYAITPYVQFLAGETLTNLFQKAVERITSNNNKLPLGELATRMVMAITSLRDGGADCFDLIEAVPFLQVYGRAEEIYLKLLIPKPRFYLIKDGRRVRDLLGKVDIPLSDTDFYVRHRDVLVIQALRASKELDYLIRKHLREYPLYLKNPIGVIPMSVGA